MIIEQLIFTIITFALFVYIFFDMIRRNDTNYVLILVLQAIGIAFNFIEVLMKVDLGIVLSVTKYIFGVILPIAIIILEKRGIPFLQIISVIKAKIYIKLKNNKKAKEQLINLVTKYPENYN